MESLLPYLQLKWILFQERRNHRSKQQNNSKLNKSSTNNTKDMPNEKPKIESKLLKESQLEAQQDDFDDCK